MIKDDPKKAKIGEQAEPPIPDIVAPTSDEDLNAAIEDTFPASDPPKLAGGITGIPSDAGKMEGPPVGTHPLAGAETVAASPYSEPDPADLPDLPDDYEDVSSKPETSP